MQKSVKGCCNLGTKDPMIYRDKHCRWSWKHNTLCTGLSKERQGWKGEMSGPGSGRRTDWNAGKVFQLVAVLVGRYSLPYLMSFAFHFLSGEQVWSYLQWGKSIKSKEFRQAMGRTFNAWKEMKMQFAAIGKAIDQKRPWLYTFPLICKEMTRPTPLCRTHGNASQKRGSKRTPKDFGGVKL